MSHLELVVGRTYIFINEDAREEYVATHCANREMLRLHYRGGFTLSAVRGASGMVGSTFVILNKELHLFKELVPTKKLEIFYYKTDGIDNPTFLHSTVPHMENMGWLLLHTQTVEVVTPATSVLEEEEARQVTIRAEIAQEQAQHELKMKTLKAKLI